MTLRLIGIAVFLLPLVSVAQNTTRYSDQYGQPIGSATTMGTTTYYSNQYGQPVGTANSTGGTTYYSNEFGQPLGSATSPTPVYTPSPPGFISAGSTTAACSPNATFVAQSEMTITRCNMSYSSSGDSSAVS